MIVVFVVRGLNGVIVVCIVIFVVNEQVFVRVFVYFVVVCYVVYQDGQQGQDIGEFVFYEFIFL